MAKRKTTELTTITAAALADGDWFPVVDVSDTTDSSTGTNKKIAKSELAEAVGVTTHAAVTSGVHGISAFGATLVDDADAATARSTLGLGTIATQAAGAVAITGGSVTGITDLAIADGGTGGSTAAAALANLTSTTLAADGDILTRSGGAPAAITRANLAADTAFSSRYAPRSAGAAAQRAFVDRLDAISDTAFLQVLGDSTGDATDEWVYLLASKFAIAYPARSVQYRLWRESTLDYGTPTQVQLGAAGRGYLSSTTGGATTADSARKSLTSCDATVRVWCRPSDLANSGDQVLCGHGGGSTSPNLGWYLYLSNNALKLALSATGSAWHTFATIANAAAVNAIATNGTDVGLGVAITRNSGGNVSYQAIYSADGITWSNFGTPYTGASSIASIYDTNGSIDVGARGTSTESFSGRIYWAEAYKGLTPSTDTLAWRFDASLWSTGTSFVDGDGHTWTLTGSASFTQGAPVLLVMNGSKGGGEIAWATTNIAALMTAPANLTLSSFGHNQDKTLAEMKTFLDLLVTTQAGTGVVAVRQNPTGSAATTKVRQDRQMARLSELIAREGYSTIDAYAAFIADGRGDSLVLSSSDVHPNSTGSTIWANTAGASFGFAST